MLLYAVPRDIVRAVHTALWDTGKKLGGIPALAEIPQILEIFLVEGQ